MELLEIEEKREAVWIWVDRPEKRNALNARVVQDLVDAFSRYRRSEHRVVVLGGRGKVFSAGADLTSLQRLQDASAEENLRDSRQLAELFQLIYEYPKPVIARVHGHAIAGGCGLATVCDFSLASAGAKLGFTEVRIGFVPAIVSAFLVRKMGEGALRDLLLRGQLISAEEASRLGLVTLTVPGEALDEEVDRLVDDISYGTSASAIEQTKTLLSALPGMGLGEAVSYAVEVNALARATDDCQAGIAAFLNREDPPWARRRETAKNGADKSKKS